MIPSDEYIEALDQFLQSGKHLLEIWKKEDDTGTLYMSEYPFEHNFERVINEIEEWLNTIQ